MVATMLRKSELDPTFGSMNHVSRYSHYVIRTLYCACVVNNRRIACAACILGGIVYMVFRSCSWSNG